MQLDVSVSGQWQALFTNKESATISTNQQTVLHYYPTDPAIITKLQDRYNNYVKFNTHSYVVGLSNYYNSIHHCDSLGLSINIIIGCLTIQIV